MVVASVQSGKKKPQTNKTTRGRDIRNAEGLCSQDMNFDSFGHSKAIQSQAAGLKNVSQEKYIALEIFSGGLFAYVLLLTIAQFNNRSI